MSLFFRSSCFQIDILKLGTEGLIGGYMKRVIMRFINAMFRLSAKSIVRYCCNEWSTVDVAFENTFDLLNLILIVWTEIV